MKKKRVKQRTPSFYNKVHEELVTTKKQLHKEKTSKKVTKANTRTSRSEGYTLVRHACSTDKTSYMHARNLVQTRDHIKMYTWTPRLHELRQVQLLQLSFKSSLDSYGTGPIYK